MNDNQRLKDLDQEAATLRDDYQALEERTIEFSQYSDLRAVSVCILLLQHLFKLGNEVIQSLELLFTHGESTTSAKPALTLEQIMHQNNWPAWLRKRFSEDTALGLWYQKFFSARPEVAKWLEVANTTTLPSKIAELKELNVLIEKIVSRTEVLVSFKDEYTARAVRTEAIRTRISAIPIPWSQYEHSRQGKYLLAHLLTNMLAVAIEEAGKAFDEVNLLQAYSSVLISEAVMRKYAIDMAAKRRSVRRLSRQYQKFVAPLEKRFGVVPHGILLTSIERFCMHLQQMDLLLAEAEESLAA